MHSIYRLSGRYDPNEERKEVVYMSNEKKFKPAGWVSTILSFRRIDSGG